MKNTLGDLNDHLFAQMERLGDEDLKGDELKNECERSKAMTSVSRNIIDNASLALKAEEMRFEGILKGHIPMLSNSAKEIPKG